MKKADTQVAIELIQGLLGVAKDSTFRSIYERIAPAPDGAIHSVVSPAATDTGRMASSGTFLEESTNLQNLSVKFAKLDPLYNVKDAIVAPPGRFLGEADMSQAEARNAAWRCGDPLAIKQYREGIDRYRFLAAAAFHGDPSKGDLVTKPQRDAGKMGLLAFQYGVGARTYMEQTNSMADLTGVTVTQATAQRIEGTFHELWPSYRVWHEEVLNEVLTRGFLRNSFGRRRDFFGRRDSESHRDRLKKQAVAFLPQSDIADAMNAAIMRIHAKYDPQLLWIHMQIHDALIFSGVPGTEAEVVEAVRSEMEVPFTVNGEPLLVPAEIKLSETSWAAAKEYTA